MSADAYAAGLIDGEGCIFVRKFNTRGTISYSLRVQVKMVDKIGLDFLSLVYGGTVGQYTTTAGGRLCYEWGLSGEKAKDFLLKIKPYTLVKRGQLELALAFPQGRQGHKYGPTPGNAETKIIQEEFFLKLKEAKRPQKEAI